MKHLDVGGMIKDGNPRWADKEHPSKIPNLVDLDFAKPYHGPALVSSEDAELLLLQCNKDNRRPRNAWVDALTKLIVNGEWQPDHPQPLMFSPGRMIDGQHRLMAIFRSGKTVQVTVYTGVRDELRQYIDSGIKRQLEDRVSFCDDLKTNEAVSKIIIGAMVIEKKLTRAISPDEAAAFFEKHKTAVLFCAPYYMRHIKGISSIPMMAALMEFYDRYPKKAAEFADALFDPDGQIQPARRLRETVMMSAPNGHGGNTYRYEVKSKSISAMKAYLEGRSLQVVRGSSW